jgi:hypothetical protein
MKNSNISFLLSFFLLLALSCGKTDDPQPLKSKEKQITYFKVTINAQEIIGAITETDKKISLSLPYNSDVKVLAPIITTSDKATVSPSSGVAQDFTSPVKYMVTAQEGTTAEYTVTVSVLPPSKCLPTKGSFSEGDFSREITYTYNSNDQIIQYNGVTSSGFSGTNTITYDAKGNPIKDEGGFYNSSYVKYSYNDKNQLIRTERLKIPDNSLDFKDEYEYNSTGQLIKKQQFSTSSGSLMKGYSTTYEYSNTTDKNWIRSKQFNEMGVLQSTIEHEYDNKKTIGTDVLKLSNETLNNVTKETRKEASGNLVETTVNSYEYNDNGYPTKIIRTETSSGSPTPTVSTSTYTYNCK